MSVSDSVSARLSSALKSRHGGTNGAINVLADKGHNPRTIRHWAEGQGAPLTADLLRLIGNHPDDAEMLLEVLGDPLTRWSRLLARAAAEDRAMKARGDADWIGQRRDLTAALRGLADPADVYFWIDHQGMHSVTDLVSGVVEVAGLPCRPDGDLIDYALRAAGWIAVSVPGEGPARADFRLSAVSPEALRCLVAAARNFPMGLVIAHELEVLPPLPASLIEAVGAPLAELVNVANGGHADGVDAIDAAHGEFDNDASLGPLLSAWQACGGHHTLGLAEVMAPFGASAMLYRIEGGRGVVVDAVGSKLPLLYGASPGQVLGRPLMETPMPSPYRAAVGARMARAINSARPVVQKMRCRSNGRDVSYTNATIPLLTAGGQVRGILGFTTHLRGVAA
jgi:hypothetical protein